MPFRIILDASPSVLNRGHPIALNLCKKATFVTIFFTLRLNAKCANYQSCLILMNSGCVMKRVIHVFDSSL